MRRSRRGESRETNSKDQKDRNPDAAAELFLSFLLWISIIVSNFVLRISCFACGSAWLCKLRRVPIAAALSPAAAQDQAARSAG